MLIKKHGFTIITSIRQYSMKERLNLMGYEGHISERSNKILEKHYPSYNKGILDTQILVRKDSHTRGYYYSILIPSCYVSDLRYKNGNARLSQEFNILFKNMFNSYNEMDLLLLLKELDNSGSIPFRKLIEYTEPTNYSKKRIHLYEMEEYLKGTDGDDMMNYENLDSSGTILYKQYNTFNWRYDKTRKLTNSMLEFMGCQIIECDYTGDNFLFLRNGQDYSSIIRKNRRWISRKYYDNNFLECDSCHNIEHNDNMLYYDDGGSTDIIEYFEDNDYEQICNSCLDRHENERFNGSIRSYGYKPSARFYSYNPKTNQYEINSIPSNKLNCGFEVEIVSRNSSTNMSKTAYEINKFNNGFLYCKWDSSVDDGFEIVSHPSSFDAIRKMDLNEAIFKHRDEYKSYNTSSCGMHIHLSRSAFNDMQLYKFVLMLNEYKGLTHLVSQRTDTSEYRRWAKFDSDMSGKVKKESYNRIKNEKLNVKYAKSEGDTERKFNFQADVYTGNRYQVINLQNPKTIEVRCFKGNLNEISFRKNLDFVEAMYYFCKDTSLNDLNVKNFVKYVKSDSKTYKSLNGFFNKFSKSLENVIENPYELI